MGCTQGRNKITRHYGRKLLFLGPPDSGKTTILYYLKLNIVVKTIPTPDFNVEMINIGNSRFEVIDIGGCVDDRRIFLHFMEDTGMVVLFIDCTGDEKRLSVAANRLELVLSELPLRFVPVAIVATKQDREAKLSCERIAEYLQTKRFMKYRYWVVFPVSIYSEHTGFPALLQWIEQFYGRIMEEGPEYQEILRVHQEQAELNRQQEINLRLMMREYNKVKFEKDKVNKAKTKAKTQRHKHRDKLRIAAMKII